MEDFEERVLTLYKEKPTLWLRYVDDTFIIWPHGVEALDEFLNYLNNQERSIKFTVEIESNNQLPFLDVLVKKEVNNSIGT